MDVVKYKKFDNEDGPVYSIGKSEIFMIRYENGSKDVFIKESEESKEEISDTTQISRKGLYLGFNIAPEMGKYQFDDSDFGFSIISGFNVNFYFNNLFGIKTGISFMNLSSSSKTGLYNEEGQIVGIYPFEGSVSSLGIPIKFVLTTGELVGFYLDAGISLYFPVSSSFGYDPKSQTVPGINTEKLLLETNSMVLTIESMIGLNVNLSNKTSLNAGISINYSTSRYFKDGVEYNSQKFYFENNSKALLLGFNIGFLFKI